MARGRIRLFSVLIPTSSGSLFCSFWSSAQLEGLQAQCTGTFWTFTLCKLHALAATKFYVQKISLQYWLWTSKGVWKYPYPVDAIHNTMSKRSLGFYTLLSMVECILSTWGCGCANEAHHEKSYCGMYSFLRMVDFQLDWSGLATATFLTERLDAEWCIRIGIWCENQTLGLNAIAYLWHFTPSSRSVMTWYHIMELGAPLAEHWLFVDSDRGDWPYCCNWLVPSIICERWPWTPTLLWLEQLVWIAYFSCLAFLHYVVVWWFQRYIPHWCYWRPVV